MRIQVQEQYEKSMMYLTGNHKNTQNQECCRKQSYTMLSDLAFLIMLYHNKF